MEKQRAWLAWRHEDGVLNSNYVLKNLKYFKPSQCMSQTNFTVLRSEQ